MRTNTILTHIYNETHIYMAMNGRRQIARINNTLRFEVIYMYVLVIYATCFEAAWRSG